MKSACYAHISIQNKFLMDGQTQYNDAGVNSSLWESDCPELQAPLFGLFLIIYVISVVSNLGMVILTKTDFRLQTPCNFFLIPDTLVAL